MNESSGVTGLKYTYNLKPFSNNNRNMRLIF